MYEGHEYSLQPVEMEKYIEESDSLDVMHIIKKINATGAVKVLCRKSDIEFSQTNEWN